MQLSQSREMACEDTGGERFRDCILSSLIMRRFICFSELGVDLSTRGATALVLLRMTGWSLG